MGRKSHSRALVAWINGQRVASWRMPARGVPELHYYPQWVESEQGRPLSISLPFQPGNQPLRGELVTNYFDNLLPDSDIIRRRLAERYRAASTSAFDMLREIGRDCVGAVQLVAEDEEPRGYDQIEGESQNEAQIERLLQRVVRPPGALGRLEDQVDDLRMSIAGAQEKTALLWHENQWVLPSGATPTTHILKLPMGRVGNEGRLDMSTSVDNEWLCLRILDAYGLPVPRSAILRFGGQRVLAVERFDRKLHESGKWWLRLPQEDFCQVKGLPSSLKYQNDGGPGMVDICQILRGSVQSKKDLSDFMKIQLLFWMLAATDGHAKNFSLRLLAGGRFHLTPFYDVVSLWPVIGNGPNKIPWQRAKLAMSVRGRNPHYHLATIQRRHFNTMAKACGLGADMESIIQDVLDRTDEVTQVVSSELPEDLARGIAQVVLSNLEQAAGRLRAMSPD